VGELLDTLKGRKTLILREPLVKALLGRLGQEEAPEVERYMGVVVAILGHELYMVPLPDWDLSYLEYHTKEELDRIRAIILRKLFDELRIVKVTPTRIYVQRLR